MRWKLKDPLAESFNPIPERTQQFPVIGEPQVLVNFKQKKKNYKRNESINKSPQQDSKIWMVKKAQVK